MSLSQRLNPMGALQLLGRSLMLPIAVLPIAGLLLRLGQPDLLDISFIAEAGKAIFDNLALIFAIGVAVGVADDNNGAAGLAGMVGYLVMTAVLGAIDPDINMGVLAGIISGCIAGLWYNRCKNIRLPDYLAFFAGRRFIPIVTGLTALGLGWIFGWIWPPIQHGIDQLGQWMIGSGSIGLFVYGLLNRLLIVTGLHHVLNSLVWFVFGHYEGATGDLNRFFAGDPDAGRFMAGFFPVMMFGLPAAALAMYHAARRDQRARVGGMLLSLALTAFLTGITEPIEFTFMFLAPVLYAIHAVLTGLSMVIMGLLNVKLGFTFSAGAFDYALSYGLSTNGWMLIPVGALYALLYYMIFRWAIIRFDLKTPGREEEAAAQSIAGSEASAGERGPAFVTALGGASNLASVGACTTRLRLVLHDSNRIDEPTLKQLGSRGIMRLGEGHLQVVLGPIADGVADEMRQALARAGHEPDAPAVQQPGDPGEQAGQQADLPPLDDETRERWMTALGGQQNLRSVVAVALTRLRLEVTDDQHLDHDALATLGVRGEQVLGSGRLHLIVGDQAARLAAGLARQAKA
ncbi:N-acetylglucosamine-specific PTS transporter subunit IIBC [Kushneria phosphatilytica]|uniref:PTS N-acetyl-D-glucosamine transporter n=1 Tax=Kushneria phosphatilytica TaxID=657387 RepID=A0A1S1NYB7_9GAMM|nr:N-acetylglucosamine-specific PTS transporter subunit IIBC [Kushneria phosphatilytica]OHV12865.1 PTS N-acetyl-D-glucosamine transporter [Kushneria phosphatilytica]QEL10724.1 PTS N-acetyl-D-glucosamine transporter [Kushneria phosphatilytica]